MNSSVDCVKTVFYRSPTVPRVNGALPSYVVVDFPNFLSREDQMSLPDKP